MSNSLANLSTDYYTGRLQYNVPLRMVDINGITFPIGINYSTTGVKVQDVSGTTGLGWSNQISGTVTREVHGLPDDYFYGFCGPNRTGGVNYSSIPKQFIEKVSEGEWDGESDKYYFSFLGINGSFVLDPDGNPLLLNNEGGISIEHSAFKRNDTARDPYWVLKDQKGIRYFFENTELMMCYVHGPVSNSYDIYKSTWNISKIVMPNNEEIKFTYESGPEITYTNYSTIRRVDNVFTSGNLSCIGDHHTADTTYNENQDISYKPNYLTKISGSAVSINFAYNFNRTDITNGKGLTDISIFYKNEKADSYKLNYDYFTSTDGSSTKRLKLLNVAQTAVGEQQRLLYKFYYNEAINLPARNSVKTDYLGYYNNNTQPTNINHYADKSPYLNNASANILQKVENVLGGAIAFTYELNDYYYQNQNVVAPGLRVKSYYETRASSDLTHYNEFSISYKLPNSSNSSGQIYSFYSSNSSNNLGISCNGTSGQMTFYSSETQQNLADMNGTYVGYSNATVSKSDGSAVRYTFTNYSDYPDGWAPALFADNFNTYNYNVLNSVVDIWCRGPVTSNAGSRGKILKEEYLNFAGQLVKDISNTYNYSAIGGRVNSLNITPYNVNINQDGMSRGYNLYGYFYLDQYLQLKKKTTTSFNNNLAKQIITEDYTYATYAKNLIQSVVTTQSGQVSKIKYRYPFDVISTIPASQPAITLNVASLVYANIISNPIETVKSTIKNGQELVIGGTVSEYYNLNPRDQYELQTDKYIPILQYTPYSVQQTSGAETPVRDSRLKLITRYSGYLNNRLISEIQPNYPVERYKSIIYGYYGAHPIAEVTNSKLADIAFTSFESDEMQRSWQYSGYLTFSLTAFTGKFQYDLSGGIITKSGLTSSNSYYVSYWTKNAASFTVSGTQGAAVLMATRNGWNNFRHLIKNVTIVNVSGNGIIDELRLHPINSTMVTHTYDPLIGETSYTNESNQTQYKEYDEFHRLQYERDADKNIRQSFCYNAAGENQNCFNFVGNSVQTGNFFKLDCAPGTIGGAVTYTVNQNSYFAKTLSIANAMAQNEIAVNGQNYANATGICNAGNIYARAELSNYQVQTYQNDQDNFGRYGVYDIWIKLYADEQCTVPYMVNTPLSVGVYQSYQSYPSSGMGSSGTIGRNITILSGSNSFFYGTNVVDASESYTDPYSGSGHVTDLAYYTYGVGSNPGYIALSSLIN